MDFLQVKTLSGKTIEWRETKITPISRVVKIQAPVFMGGLIWNRPVAVTFKKADGSEQVIPVPDITRQVELTLLGAGILVFLVIWLFVQVKSNIQKNGGENER